MCSSVSDLSQRAARQSMGVSHTGAFQLAEVDLAALVPDEALVPFAEELQSRDRRRERRVKVRAVTHLDQHTLNDMALCMQRTAPASLEPLFRPQQSSVLQCATCWSVLSLA